MGLAVLAFTGCAADDFAALQDDVLLIVHQEDRYWSGLAVDGEYLHQASPVWVSADATLWLDGPEGGVIELLPGTVLEVSTGTERWLDVMEPGVDVDPDRVLLDADLPDATWLALQHDALLFEHGSDFLLEGEDVLARLADAGGVPNAEVYPVAADLPRAHGQVDLPLDPEARTALAERLGAAGIGDVDVEQRMLADFGGAVEAAPPVRDTSRDAGWVGLHLTDDLCLFLDVEGGAHTPCEGNLAALGDWERRDGGIQVTWDDGAQEWFSAEDLGGAQ